MSLLSPAVPRTIPTDVPAGRSRRKLVRRDRVSRRLAELDGIRALLVRAEARVEHGWVQQAWLSYVDPLGVPRVTTATVLPPGVGQLAGVCLVSSVRLSGDGQQVDRALDLVWHTLHETDGAGWAAPPDVRLARVRDLARWNDQPGRTADEVIGLLAATEVTATGEMARLRSEAAATC